MCEVVFAIGNNIYNIGYKYTGTASQAALQIVNTFTQLAMILSQGIGTAAGIMLGKLLGENKLELVRPTADDLWFLYRQLHLFWE